MLQLSSDNNMIINGGTPMSKYWKDWAKAAIIRAIKTIAQTATAVFGTMTIVSTTDIETICITSATAGVLSLLTSVAGLPEIGTNKPNQ